MHQTLICGPHQDWLQFRTSVSKFVVPGAAQLVAQFMVLPFGSILLLPNFPTAQFSVAIISYINSVLPCFPTLLFFVDDFSRCPIFRLPFLSLPFLQLPFLPWIVQTWHHPQNWEHIASEEDWAMARSSSHQNVSKFRHLFLSYLVELNILGQNSSKTTKKFFTFDVSTSIRGLHQKKLVLGLLLDSFSTPLQICVFVTWPQVTRTQIWSGVENESSFHQKSSFNFIGWIQ